MAKVLYSEMVGNVIGSISGLTWQQNQAGPFVRRRGRPRRTPTILQVLQRTWHRTCTNLWNVQLTPAQRAAWNAFAVLHPRTDPCGNSIPRTGFQIFLSINMALLRAGQTPILDPPADTNVTAPASVSVTASGGGSPSVVVTISPPIDPSEAILFYFSRPLHMSSTLPWQNTTQGATGTTGEYSAIDITTEYLARYGLLPSGTQIKVGVRILNTVNGALSPLLSILAPVS